MNDDERRGQASTSGPAGGHSSAPDTVTVYRVNSGRINPFDAP